MSIGQTIMPPASGPIHYQQHAHTQQPLQSFQPLPPLHVQQMAHWHQYQVPKAPAFVHRTPTVMIPVAAPQMPLPHQYQQNQARFWYPYDNSANAVYHPVAFHQTGYYTPPMQTTATFGQTDHYAYKMRQPLMNGQPVMTALNNPVMSACRATAEPKSIAEIYMEDPSSEIFRDLQLIPDSASTIPPHPSIEDSAVPFAAMGADFCWEFVHTALDKGAALRRASSRDKSPANFSYGTIGGERLAAKQAAAAAAANNNAAYDSVHGQGKSLVGPLTPPPSSTLSTACPIPPQWQSKKFVNQEIVPWADNYWEMRSPENSPVSASGKPAPFSAYAQFMENLLNVTLVTPQTLLLALRFMLGVCKSNPIGIYTRFSSRSAPYKLLAGALVLANKVLDDNSYKSMTWSQVSAVPCKDLTEAETFIFESLSYNVSPSSTDWRDFLVNLSHKYSQHSSMNPRLLSQISTYVK